MSGTGDLVLRGRTPRGGQEVNVAPATKGGRGGREGARDAGEGRAAAGAVADRELVTIRPSRSFFRSQLELRRRAHLILQHPRMGVAQ